MDVWWKWARRQADCCHCNLPIAVSSPMVIKKLWRKGDENNRRVNIRFYYHPECYMAEGFDYLTMNPYTAGTRKRGPKSSLTPEQQRARRLILMRRASLLQRKRKLKSPYPDRLLMEARIDEKLTDLMIEIAPLGGIPTSWLKVEVDKSSVGGKESSPNDGGHNPS